MTEPVYVGGQRYPEGSDVAKWAAANTVRRDTPHTTPYQALTRRTKPKAEKAKAMKNEPSESEFTRQVIELADLCGFLVVHFRPAMVSNGTWVTAMSGDKGFPDLVMCRENGQPRVIVAELKVGKNKTSAEQDRWLDSFRRAHVEAYLWRPVDWPEIERVLKP